ncbi:cellulose biosynthesis cyclic di-GMP-binding regulatory protein BcsB [Pseudomonas oryzihabitans]|uniref:cellulose biosynthesis cyclic di-GMP-binding regulatory protein BcsB n=1 Tax=Pseudomonas oryzihabitans TaxID=47885 RepID=UPI003F5A130A
MDVPSVHNPLPSSSRPAWAFSLLVLALSVCTALPTQAAQTTDPVVAAPEMTAATTVGEAYTYTLKQLGARYPMSLRGVDGSDSVRFGIRSDEVVTSARLSLEYSYSPALLPDLSQINVLVNDEVAASLPVPKENAGKLLQTTLDIPPRLITDVNRLTLQLIGHYTMQCEDPLHSSLWAKIGTGSELQLQVTRIVLDNDLATLPRPFFDYRDARPLVLPFVIPDPNNTALEAAGNVAAWFGALSGSRGARFPTVTDGLPDKGNAVVLLDSPAAAERLGLTLTAKTGPTLAILTNPHDPNGKLLVLAGRDGAELKRAAQGLTLGNQALSGARVTLDRLDTLVPRRPYDAPNWLPSDRPVKLGELTELKNLGSSGYNPGNLTVPLRLPPDLFLWQDQGAPLDLKYRYTPQPVSTNSSLLVSIDDRFLKSLSLPSREHLDSGLLATLKSDDDGLPRETQIRIPLDGVSAQAPLQFRFMYDYIKQGECRDVIIDNMRGTIEPESTLDLSGYHHFIAMPNLGVFKDSGFPFTRMADLSETAVVLDEKPSMGELGAYLTLLGRFGAATGYPAPGVAVVRGAQLDNVAQRDLLVLTTGSSPLLQQWASSLPAALDGSSRRFEFSDLALRVRNWLSPDPRDNLRKARTALGFNGGGSSAYVAGFESPLSKGRSVVLFAATDAAPLEKVTSDLAQSATYTQDLQGSLAVIKNERIDALVADQTYYVGHLGPLLYLRWLLAGHPLLMLLATALAVGLLATPVFLALRARARRRLQG